MYAVDLSPIGIQKTIERVRFHKLQDNVKAYCGDCCELEKVLPPDWVDFTLGFSILHHLPPREFGRSLRKVLKPGGTGVFFENSNANPLYRLRRRFFSNESPGGAPLTEERVSAFIAEIGAGRKVYPRFGLFSLSKKYVFQNNKVFSTCVETVDRIIDKIPGSRIYSAHMWVVVYKTT